MQKTILVIDDDVKLIELLTKYLSQFDLMVISSTNPMEGVSLVQQKKPDLVILDVMMPEKNGFELCREIRRVSPLPIIMLTARGEVTDRIIGLELGADDYVSKPFEPRELLARIQSIIRRSGTAGHAPSVRFGPLEMDLNRRTATLDGQPLDLTTTEFDALSLFASQPGKVLSREEIMERLRGVDWQADNRSVDVLISRLRQKLKDDPKNPSFFKTIWGTGYLFVAERSEKGR
jgi:DNA-binding response OmpR family regulator